MLGFAAIPIVTVASRSGLDPGREPEPEPENNHAAVVEVIHPEVRPHERALRIPASLQGFFAADLYAKASGYVSEVNVDIGSTVTKGDALLRIDVPEMAEELRQAEARLAAKEAQVEAAETKLVLTSFAVKSAEASARRAQAEQALRRATHRRKQQLYEERAISDQDRDEAQHQLAIAEAQTSIAEAEIESAEAEQLVAQADLIVAKADVAVARAEVDRLKTLMAYATIIAPFDGVITKRLADPGAFVRSAADGAETPLLRLTRTDRLRLVLDIPEPECPHIDVGSQVDVEIPALGAEPLKTTIARTAGGLDPATRTMRVEVDLENGDGRLLPGMYARAVVRIVAGDEALMIPSAAVRSRGAETYVLVADGDVAKEVAVDLGRDDGIRAVVTAGLEGGEQIISSATSAVAPGVPVQPVPVQDALARPEG